ncbi:MAG TPA: HpsJ family protein, partial [Stenomitos sp.]
MNATDSRPLRQTSFVLPFVGTLLLLTLIVDFVIQSFSLQWSNPQAKLNFFNEIIDRGVIALIGLTLVYAGFWLNNALNPPVVAEPGNPTANSPLRNPQFWNFVVASLLGLVFLLLLPVHFGASGEIYTAATTQADQREAQIKYQIQQQQQEIQAVLSSGQLDQLLQQKNLPPDRL